MPPRARRSFAIPAWSPVRKIVSRFEDERRAPRYTSASIPTIFSRATGVEQAAAAAASARRSQSPLPHRVVDGVADLREILIVPRDRERLADRARGIETDARVGPILGIEGLRRVTAAA